MIKKVVRGFNTAMEDIISIFVTLLMSIESDWGPEDRAIPCDIYAYKSFIDKRIMKLLKIKYKNEKINFGSMTQDEFYKKFLMPVTYDDGIENIPSSYKLDYAREFLAHFKAGKIKEFFEKEVI